MNSFTQKVEDLPELETEVAIAGTAAQQEVGGPICLGVAVVIIFS